MSRFPAHLLCASASLREFLRGARGTPRFCTAILAAACLGLAGCGQGNREPAVRAAAPPVVRTAAGAEMILVPGGRFEMGSTGGAPDEVPVRAVQISAFLLDRCEVTQAQFAAVQLPDPSHFKAPVNPVDQANWTDAARFCNERSRAEGLQPCYDEKTWECDVAADGYRLPTEAEWEYACRAGSRTQYSCGDDPRALGVYAWFDGNAGNRTHPVGQKQPNPWGFHDLHGNVAEWCNDRFDASAYAEGAAQDPRGPATGGQGRVVRGGSWKSAAAGCRSAGRAGDQSVLDTCLASDALGFRCARKAPPAAPPAALK
jgi:formylglycine-generating enzyme required for sulfatase activity